MNWFSRGLAFFSASPRPASTVDQDKRPCSTVGNISRSVPVARSDGSEYLASCAFQSSNDYGCRERDSVVPNKPICEASSSSSGGKMRFVLPLSSILTNRVPL